MSKYFSVRWHCKQGHNHHSKKEATRCDELRILENGGEITMLTQQPRINLLPGFRYKGESVRGINYIADFKYFDNKKNAFVIEDTKGFRTKEYKIKRKMLLSIIKESDQLLFIET
jgi:hypothetical protein